jgi:post-segregation antitoxin (ccd killing protein)
MLDSHEVSRLEAFGDRFMSPGDPPPQHAASPGLALVRRGWDHLRAQRPLAAWADWQQALRLDPQDHAARQALDTLAATPALPSAARVPYRFRPPASPNRRLAWDQALRHGDLSDLQTSAQTFEAIAEADPTDAPALYNLALCQAWQGRNIEAIATLAAFVDRLALTDPDTAANAWTLAEVLRHGGGAEALADDLNYSGRLAWPADRGDPARLAPDGQARLVPLGTSESWPPFEWLDRPMPDLSGSGTLDADRLPHVLASLAWADGRLRYASPDADAVDALLAPDALGALADADPTWHRERHILPLNLLDAAIFTFRLPAGLDPEARNALSHDAIAHAYEDRWIHEPRLGLADSSPSADPSSGRTPLEAAREVAAQPEARPALAARLEGLIRLREQLARRPGYESLYARYSFDRLRRRLGLPTLDPNTVPDHDLRSMSRTQLQALDPSTQSPDEREQARRSAEGLGDPSLARRFLP